MIKIAPSILAADPLNLERDVRRTEEAGCDWLHIDIMDAHFVPNLAYSPEVVRRLKEATGLPLDVHLMMDHPETLAEQFLDAGADILTIHAEADTDPEKLIALIHKAGAKAGIALKPGTSEEAVLPLLEQTELILAMTVEPGFGGQKLDESVLDKIRRLRATGWQGWIEADGGISEDNIARLYNAGLDVAVIGTAVFREKDMRAAVKRMHHLLRKSEA